MSDAGGMWPNVTVLFAGEPVPITGQCEKCSARSVGLFHNDEAMDALDELCADCGTDKRLYAGDLPRVPELPDSHDERVFNEDLVDDPDSATPRAHRARRLIAAAARRGIDLLLPGENPRRPRALLSRAPAGCLGSEAGDGIFAGMADAEPYDPTGATGRVRSEPVRVLIAKGFGATVDPTGLCWGRDKCLRPDNHEGDCLFARNATLEEALNMGFGVWKP